MQYDRSTAQSIKSICNGLFIVVESLVNEYSGSISVIDDYEDILILNTLSGQKEFTASTKLLGKLVNFSGVGSSILYREAVDDFHTEDELQDILEKIHKLHSCYDRDGFIEAIILICETSPRASILLYDLFSPFFDTYGSSISETLSRPFDIQDPPRSAVPRATYVSQPSEECCFFFLKLCVEIFTRPDVFHSLSIGLLSNKLLIRNSTFRLLAKLGIGICECLQTLIVDSSVRSHGHLGTHDLSDPFVTGIASLHGITLQVNALTMNAINLTRCKNKNGISDDIISGGKTSSISNNSPFFNCQSVSAISCLKEHLADLCTCMASALGLLPQHILNTADISNTLLETAVFLVMDPSSIKVRARALETVVSIYASLVDQTTTSELNFWNLLKEKSKLAFNFYNNSMNSININKSEGNSILSLPPSLSNHHPHLNLQHSNRNFSKNQIHLQTATTTISSFSSASSPRRTPVRISNAPLNPEQTSAAVSPSNGAAASNFVVVTATNICEWLRQRVDACPYTTRLETELFMQPRLVASPDANNHIYKIPICELSSVRNTISASNRGGALSATTFNALPPRNTSNNSINNMLASNSCDSNVIDGIMEQLCSRPASLRRSTQDFGGSPTNSLPVHQQQQVNRIAPNFDESDDSSPSSSVASHNNNWYQNNNNNNNHSNLINDISSSIQPAVPAAAHLSSSVVPLPPIPPSSFLSNNGHTTNPNNNNNNSNSMNINHNTTTTTASSINNVGGNRLPASSRRRAPFQSNVPHVNEKMGGNMFNNSNNNNNNNAIDNNDFAGVTSLKGLPNEATANNRLSFIDQQDLVYHSDSNRNLISADVVGGNNMDHSLFHDKLHQTDNTSAEMNINISKPKANQKKLTAAAAAQKTILSNNMIDNNKNYNNTSNNDNNNLGTELSDLQLRNGKNLISMSPTESVTLSNSRFLEGASSVSYFSTLEDLPPLNKFEKENLLGWRDRVFDVLCEKVKEGNQPQSDEWRELFDAMNNLRRLSLYASNVVQMSSSNPSNNNLSDAFVAACRNALSLIECPRSALSKNALLTARDLFCIFQSKATPLAEQTFISILKKCADPQIFLSSSAADAALMAATCCNELRMLLTLTGAMKTTKSQNSKSKIALCLGALGLKIACATYINFSALGNSKATLASIDKTKIQEREERLLKPIVATLGTLAMEASPESRTAAKSSLGQILRGGVSRDQLVVWLAVNHNTTNISRIMSGVNI